MSWLGEITRKLASAEKKALLQKHYENLLLYSLLAKSGRIVWKGKTVHTKGESRMEWAKNGKGLH